MNPHKIIFFLSGHFNQNCLHEITQLVVREFNCAVEIRDLDVNIAEYYDPLRRQYNANLIMQVVNDKYGEIANAKKLALVAVDLYIPILTFIFGQAIFNGSTGVVSNYRLKNEQYGLNADQELLLERFKKVIIHELGHLFGLKHCHVPNCVMRSSTYVEDIDQKKDGFCNNCKDELFGNLNNPF